MNAEIIERKWVQAWFDERQCNHMPSLICNDEGTLLATWTGGLLHWNGDPMGRDCTIWLARLDAGAEEWTNPQGLGTDMRYACHNSGFAENRHGEIIVIFTKFLDTHVNSANWCAGRDKLWTRKSQDGGVTWLPEQETNIPLIGHPSNDAVLLADGTIVLAISSTEDPDHYFGTIRILYSYDDGESWELGPLLTAADDTKIREPALALRSDGDIQMFTRACPVDLGWGRAGYEGDLWSYKSRSSDGGKTWTPPVASSILNNEAKIELRSWPDGSLLMAYDRTRNLDWHERSPLWLACSEDEGETWEDVIELAPAPGVKAQPAMCQGPDGRLHVVYMHRHTAVEHIVVEIA